MPALDIPDLTEPLVGIIMGSQSDWPTLTHAAEMLARLHVPHEVKIVSAHRTPDRLRQYAMTARDRGLKIIIAGAGGAAHLPGMCASWTPLPVLGVPVESHALKGMDSLLSIVQMPAGIPVGTMAIGRAGAVTGGVLSFGQMGAFLLPAVFSLLLRLTGGYAAGWAACAIPAVLVGVDLLRRRGSAEV